MVKLKTISTFVGVALLFVTPAIAEPGTTEHPVAPSEAEAIPVTVPVEPGTSRLEPKSGTAEKAENTRGKPETAEKNAVKAEKPEGNAARTEKTEKPGGHEEKTGKTEKTEKPGGHEEKTENTEGTAEKTEKSEASKAVEASGSKSESGASSRKGIHRLEQPWPVRVGMTVGGVVLIGLEFWWFVLCKSRTS